MSHAVFDAMFDAHRDGNSALEWSVLCSVWRCTMSVILESTASHFFQDIIRFSPFGLTSHHTILSIYPAFDAAFDIFWYPAGDLGNPARCSHHTVFFRSWSSSIWHFGASALGEWSACMGLVQFIYLVLSEWFPTQWRNRMTNESISLMLRRASGKFNCRVFWFAMQGSTWFLYALGRLVCRWQSLLDYRHLIWCNERQNQMTSESQRERCASSPPARNTLSTFQGWNYQCMSHG